MSIGISKRELLEDYYPGEFAAIVSEWNQMHGAKDDTPEQTDAQAFLGGGGEILDG